MSALRSSSTYVVDSGAFRCLVPHMSDLHNTRPLAAPLYVQLGSGQPCAATRAKCDSLPVPSVEPSPPRMQAARAPAWPRAPVIPVPSPTDITMTT